MGYDVVGHAVAEVVELGAEDGFEVGVGIDVEVGCAAEEVEGGDEPYESEAVVAVEVGDEDGVESGEFELGAAQLELGAFATVYHIEFFSDVDDLGGGVVAGGGEG